MPPVAERPADARRGSRSKRGAVVVEELDRASDERWSDFVRSSPGGSAYALPAYLDALCEATGAGFRVLAAVRGDEIVGGVAVFERTSPLGPWVAPRLLLYYNGIVLRDYDTRYPSERIARKGEVVDALAEALVARRYGRLELRSRSHVADVRSLQARGFSVSPSYSYVVPLDDLDAQWSRVEQNLRRLVERARREGLELDPEGAPEELYRLHHETHVRKGAPLYLPRDRFLRFVERLRAAGLGAVYAARFPDGRVAAAQLVLLGHPITHTVMAAGDAELQRTGSSPFLRWHAFVHLASIGATGNDLTDAAPSPVERFKSQLGGTLETGYVAVRQTVAHRLQLHAGRRARDVRVRLRGSG